MFIRKYLFAVGVILSLGASFPASSTVIGWDFSVGGFTGGGVITGMFSADDQDLADGSIRGDELVSFMFTYSGGTAHTAFAFDLATTTLGAGTFTFEYTPGFPLFGVNVNMPPPSEPEWALHSSGFGSFHTFSGPGGSTSSTSTLIVTPKTVPEPATLLLLGLGLFGLCFNRRRTQG